MVLLHNIETEKNVLNLYYHKDDFRVAAKWYFLATSYRKGACDGLGGTAKQLAAQASLLRSYNDQLMTPCQLSNWASANVPAAHLGYCSNED